MSRPTTSQIIERGDYLQPDFDPASLTIPHLIGIFAYHQIQYPSQHTKAKLVEVFNKEIKAKGARLRQQRLVRQETLASDNGILDGVTGLPIAPEPPMPTRRSSRRLSREPVQEIQRPNPPKRRRSSAQPSFGGPSTKKTIDPIVISEESEEEEYHKPEPEAFPKVGKKKNSEAAGPSSRRVSQNFGPGTEDSGWEDNNVFQSGAESSSPVRPPKPNPTRKTSTRMSRMSMSAPPEIDSSPTRPAPKSQLFSPPNTNFDPKLPFSMAKPKSRIVTVKDEIADDYFEDNSALADISADISGEAIEEEDEEDEEGDQGDIQQDSQTVEVAQRIADGGSGVLARRKQLGPPKAPFWQRALITTIAFLLAGVIGQYKVESSKIGYCETGSRSNAVLADLQNKKLDKRLCYTERTDETSLIACPPPAVEQVIQFVQPDACTPCPAHGRCTLFDVHCDEGYVLSPHLLSLVPYASTLANGLPVLGPIAFPPKCVIDEARKRSIGVLGKKIDSTLAAERGSRVCAGIDSQRSIDGGEARRWGFETDYLITLLKKKYVREGDRSAEDFDRLFGEAVDQLTKYGRLIQDFDSEGKMYLASDHEDMSWSCQLTVAARNSWAEWRNSVFGLIGATILALAGKAQLAARNAEKQRVGELVQIALDTLRDQEMAHHTDPVVTPEPYLSSLQLRDHVLQNEHSIPARVRLWDRVERIVEGNANVRANLEELPGGEEARVWRWVGSSGLLSPAARRISKLSSPGETGRGRIVA